MTNFIPIFPLGIVVYPGEKLNLHIFEPRYKQLIAECFQNKKPFGIPAVINNSVAEMGTLVYVTEITKTYDDGKMDIKTKAESVFKILELIKEMPDKLYSGAIVSYLVNTTDGSRAIMKKVVDGLRELHSLIHTKKDFKKADEELCSYDVAHHMGLNLQQEYELLQLKHELQRQEFLKRHIQNILPVLTQMELLKEKINLNGHFKNLESFNL